MRMSILSRFAIGLFALNVASSVVNAETYEPPKNWQGTENGKADNNPVVVDGKPQWRFVQAWPDDLSDGENLIPLIWTGESWQSDGHDFGGQPSVSINRTTVTLGSRGAWGNDGNFKGGKWAGLGFTAPKDGKYTVETKVSADVWNGDGPVNLVILKLNKDKEATEIKNIELAKGAEPTPLEEVSVDLAEGEELVFVARVNQMYTAANIKLARMKIVTAE
jgi:hypothetical protein